MRQQASRNRLEVYAAIVPNNMKLEVLCDDDVSFPNCFDGAKGVCASIEAPKPLVLRLAL